MCWMLFSVVWANDLLSVLWCGMVWFGVIFDVSDVVWSGC